NAELETVTAACVRDLLHHVALAALPGAVPDGVFRRFRRPEAEAVVMLAGENRAAHTARLQCGDDLIGIELRRIEDPRVFVAVTPLPVGEGVDPEVQESAGLYLMPGDLASGWQRTVRHGRGDGTRSRTGRRECGCGNEGERAILQGYP